MYNEIDIIKKVTKKRTKIKLLLEFIIEYSQWCQHLKSLGLTWGAEGEECKSSKELTKANKHINKLKTEIISLFDNL